MRYRGMLTKALAVVGLVMSASVALAETDDVELGLTERDPSRPITWICRATAMDDSGLFFIGIGRSQAEAYTKALETCNRQNRRCIINCEPQI